MSAVSLDGKWITLDDLGVSSETWCRNKDSRGEGSEGSCIRCGLPVDHPAGWASYTTGNFLIPADIVNDYPTEGDTIPERFAALVAEYGPGRGMWPVGSECAKKMAGYVTGGSR